MATVCIVAVYLAGVLAFYVTRTYPLEYREGSVLVQMWNLLGGRNPYSVESHPLAMNGYGVLLGVLTSPLSYVFGSSLTHFRLISCGFLLASTCLIYFIYRFERFDRLSALAAGLCFLNLLIRSAAIAARPDALGIFILISALAVAHFGRYSKRSFFVAIIICCIGWLAKPYFIIGGATISLFAALKVSLRLGLILATVFACCLASLVYFVDLLFPMYLTDTFFIHVAATGNSLSHLFFQLKWILSTELLLIAGIVIAVSVAWKQKAKEIFGSIFFWQLCVSSIVFMKIGRHGGSQEYHLHLITPFLILALSSSEFVKRVRSGFALFVFIPQLLFTLPMLPVDRTADWKAIEEKLKAFSSPILNSPTSVHLAFKLGFPVFDSGQSEYFSLGQNRFNPRSSLVAAQQSEFDQTLKSMIANKEFTLIIYPYIGSGLINRNDLVLSYRMTGSLIAYCGAEDWVGGLPYAQFWPIEFWEPI